MKRKPEEFASALLVIWRRMQEMKARKGANGADVSK
jgi:hypothetical protein